MSKSFRQFLAFFKFSNSNNFKIFDDFIIYDSLMPSFLEYPLTPVNLDFRKFFKYSIKKSSISNLLSLFHFKFQHLTKIDVFKDNKIYHFKMSYRERSRTISYPLDNDFDFFLTITFRNPFKDKEFDIFKTVSFNDYINEVTKKGFKRMRDYFRRRYQLQLKKKLYGMDISQLEELFGFVPSTEDIDNYIKSEVKELMNKNFKYFRVYEVHKSNVIHIHALVKFPDFFTSLDFQEMIEKIASWFQTERNGIELDRIRKSNKKSSSKVKSYILKYMNKQFQTDNLVYVENEKQEKIYILKTSAFVLNFVNRIISYSRNVIRKLFRPFAEFSLEENDNSNLKMYREFQLLNLEIEKKEYEDFKFVVDRFETLSKKVFRNFVNNQIEVGYSAYILNEFLEDRYFSIEKIQKALDLIRFDNDFKVLYVQAYQKFNTILEEIEEDDINDEIVDF
jgi:hypothetical protein